MVDQLIAIALTNKTLAKVPRDPLPQNIKDLMDSLNI